MGNESLLCIGALLLALMLPFVSSLEMVKMEASSVIEAIPYVTPKYDRIEEAERACEGVIDSASELSSTDISSSDLSFTYGDWNQETSTTRPLLPYIDVVGFNKSAPPMKLSTFSITDYSYEHRTKSTVRVNGVLDLVITRHGSVYETENSQVPTQFGMWNGHTQVSVFFQGIYMESEENGGERVMCLLGSAELPTRQSGSADPWEHIKPSDLENYNPPLLADDQILLVLHYPLRFTLTNRKIEGKMTSLSPKTGLKYFDKVQILSQLTTQQYKFGSQPEAVHKACDPSYSKSDFLSGVVDIYKGHEFCLLFQAFKRRSLLEILPNWKCSGTEKFCSKVGPFITDDKERFSSYEDGGVLLLMQNFHCEPKRLSKGNVTVAKVSLVLRFAPSPQSWYIERKRSGLGNMTVSAEGVWNSSTGQLCMVGCLGIGESGACDSRVCFYMPTGFSITQRSPLVGSISSIKPKNPSYFPLSFQFPVRYQIPRYLGRYANLQYKYSKIGLAGALHEKHKSSNLGSTIKTSLLNYPRMRKNEDLYSSSLLLAEDLSFYSRAVLDPSSNSEINGFVSMSIFSLGSIFGTHTIYRNVSYSQGNSSYREKDEYTMKQLLVNVSAQLSITGETNRNFSSFSVEGLYDTLVGKMYMIGCRRVTASSKVLSENTDLVHGFDCSTEVIIFYPAVTAQWLLNPTVHISITSTRSEDDPLYFKPMTVKTLPITYRRQREDALSETQLETVLRLLTLSFVVACILLQLLYTRRAPDSIAYVSLVMLGVQALGYGLPLITNVEALFKRKTSETETMSYQELRNIELYDAIGFSVKLVVLAAFLLTLRLLQKVWKCRIKFLRQQLFRVPNEKTVLLITSVVHVLGFVCAVYVHAPKTRLRWMILVEEYTGVVQDLFLFPQVVGNLVWQIEAQPLRKLYYVGISIARIIPHVYDYFRASTLNPYFSREFVLVNRDTDFYSKVSDVIIPVFTALLVVLVYVQQRWSYGRLSDAIAVGSFRLLPRRPKAYKALPSQLPEAELASHRDQQA